MLLHGSLVLVGEAAEDRPVPDLFQPEGREGVIRLPTALVRSNPRAVKPVYAQGGSCGRADRPCAAGGRLVPAQRCHGVPTVGTMAQGRLPERGRPGREPQGRRLLAGGVKALRVPVPGLGRGNPRRRAWQAAGLHRPARNPGAQLQGRGHADPVTRRHPHPLGASWDRTIMGRLVYPSLRNLYPVIVAGLVKAAEASQS